MILCIINIYYIYTCGVILESIPGRACYSDSCVTFTEVPKYFTLMGNNFIYNIDFLYSLSEPGLINLFFKDLKSFPKSYFYT